MLFWIPVFIILSSIINLMCDKDSGKMDFIVSQTTGLYVLIGMSFLLTIWTGLLLGITWLTSNSAKEMLNLMWDNFYPLRLLALFFQHYDGYQFMTIVTLILLFGYCVTISLYYNFTGLKDYKVISTYVSSSWYYEAWTERCTRTITKTDSNGNSKTRTETYYVHHPPYWEAKLGDGTIVKISSSDFGNYCETFGNKTFKDILHINQSSIGDGNAYYSKWDGTDEKLIPAAYKKDYLNFITASKNTVLVSNVDEIKYSTALSDDPDIEDSKFGEIEIDRVTTTGMKFDESLAQSIDAITSKWLAKNGGQKEVNIMYYFTNQDINFWFALHEIRKGGRFNEVLVIVGIDEATKKINWCKTMAWDNSQLCNTIDNNVTTLGYIQSADSFCSIVIDAVNSYWVKPNMDKYRYLASDIKLPFGYILLGILIVTLVCSPLVAYFYHHNYAEMFEATGELIEQLLKKKSLT